LADAKDIAVGADVHAIGHPTGEAWSYTEGIISQIRNGYTWETEAKMLSVFTCPLHASAPPLRVL
jgi:S1-C subfamily serine protease